MLKRVLDFNAIVNRLASEVNTNFGEIDCIITAGGKHGWYGTGAIAYLNALQRQNKLTVRNASGASAGAICAVYLKCLQDTNTWADIYTNMYNHYTKKGYIMDICETHLCNGLSIDAYKQCTNTYITVTDLTGIPKHTMLTNFESNSELAQAVTASCSIPYITYSRPSYPYKQRQYIDGLISLHPPINIKTLYLNLHQFKHHTNPLKMDDPYIDDMVVRGIYDMHLFLTTGYKCPTIYWYTENKRKIRNGVVRGWVISFLYRWGFKLHYLLHPYIVKIIQWCT